jgi:predicted AlkP superfamily pyrophosphatase or phosphodiesterase
VNGVRSLLLLLLLGRGFGAAAPPAKKLLVISVDGLDHRYLRDRDQLGRRIPNIRRMLKQGRYAQGVVGVYPTVTWPSHTSLITGVRPDQHAILGNRRPRSEGGDYYWTVDLLKSRTLWQAAHERGWTTAAVTWPVTVGSPITFNLPEYFQRRNGGAMDLESVAAKGTPGLAEDIASAYPSFPQQWVDDRTRTLAVLYLLRRKQPDLVLVHLVDLDSEEHDRGPFERNANAILELTDELIGQMLAALPPGYNVALVSDHGFERVDKIANLPVLLAENGITGEMLSMGGIAATSDPKVAAFFRESAKKPETGIGREIPHPELVLYAPQLSGMIAVFEPAEHVMFGAMAKGPYFTPPSEKGNHGFWPLRQNYRSVFAIFGPGVKPGVEPEIQMISIAARLATLLGLQFP